MNKTVEGPDPLMRWGLVTVELSVNKIKVSFSPASISPARLIETFSENYRNYRDD